jgi:hypothetical protein
LDRIFRKVKNLKHDNSIGNVSQIAPRKVSSVQNAYAVGMKYDAEERNVTTVT